MARRKAIFLRPFPAFRVHGVNGAPRAAIPPDRKELPVKTLDIELLALDLAVCGRCSGTLANLREALRAVRPALAALGVEAVLSRTLVESEEQAERLRFASSPTIRIAGREIAGAPHETACGPCTELAGSAEAIDCRAWPWRGRTFDAAPVGMLVEAILHAALDAEQVPVPPSWSGVPANIRAFLRGRARSAGCCNPEADACCGAAPAEKCCEPACCQ